MIGNVGTVISLVVLVLAWLFFSKVIKGKTTASRRVKAAIVVLLFATLLLRFSQDLYATISRALFSMKKQGDVELTTSPFSIPGNQNNSYCRQFKNQYGEPIEVISTREDGRYCGDFWGFKTKQKLYLPYQNYDASHAIYWASPTLQIVGPRP
ncbi:hypothetical protein Lade_1309 [Legionella adelaidensis]|uniref:Uncharacterized protein n=1 Tax=Legionella adelaidensis TaxID=45056 RepID=A0A0W0R6K3_9GAMM|nr:hypothetical protein [Legionella adelaidensis]KTC66651.1 hypothetical protein Lade_1309 [Legionella adelaidensis]